MRAQEQQPQRVVGDAGAVAWRRVVAAGPLLQLLVDARGDPLPAQRVEREVARDAEHPRLGVVRHTVGGPDAQRAQQRLLHDVLDEVEPARAEHAAQPGDHARVAVPEQLGDELGRDVGHGRRYVSGPPMKSSSRTSMLPKRRFGWPSQSATAWS